MKVDQLLKEAQNLAGTDLYLKDLLVDYENTNDQTLKADMQRDILDYTQEILRTKELK